MCLKRQLKKETLKINSETRLPRNVNRDFFLLDVEKQWISAGAK